MPETPQKNVPTPFDQGVFLIHYNRGREALQTGRFGEARKELEAAQRMRPNDSEVLNLLGLVYFRLEAYPEAETIYRRLTEKNPDVFILRSNLGLVLFKQGKIEEAEEHLLRSIELRPNYTKSHLYLGMLYKKKGKLGLALEHLKFAGADRVADEVEDAMRPANRSPSFASPAPAEGRGAAKPESEPQDRRGSGGRLIDKPLVSTQPGTIPIPSEEDPPFGGEPATSEARSEELEPPPFPDEDVSSAKTKFDSELPPFEQTPAEISAASKLQKAVDGHLEDRRRIDLRTKEGASRKFVLHENGFLEINFTDRVTVRRGTISSYSGNLRFREESTDPGTFGATMVSAEGSGRLIVYDKARQTFLLDLNDEFVFVEGAHLLALEQSLSSRPEPIFDSAYQTKLDMVKVYGRGSLAISTSIEPLTLRVKPDYPLSIASTSIVAWTGDLLASVVDDSALEEIMVETSSESFRVRFEGSGVVVSER